jgi:hypothetical protein
VPHSRAEEVLGAWREAERELEAVTPGSPDEDRLQAYAAALRDEYQRLVAQLKADDELPALPGSPEGA